MDREQMEREQAGELKVIPFNPKSPHPDLVPDEIGIQLLKERHADHDTCWTMRTPAPTIREAMEYVTNKALMRAYHRTCPVHGEVEVVNKNYHAKETTCVDGLSCGHTLMVTRLVGMLKATYLDVRRHSSWTHRGWLFTFKETMQATRR